MEKKSMFIRCLWGVYTSSEYRGLNFSRRQKMDSDIDFLIKHNRYNSPFVTYVFGTENYDYLMGKGLECKLVSDEPFIWDMNKEQYRHKIEVLRLGIEDYDEVILLDWDTIPMRPLPDNFWLKIREKESFQAALRIYHKGIAYWRRNNCKRYIPCASFVYVNDKQVTDDLVDIWEGLGRPWSEEMVMARYVDLKMGESLGLDFYKKDLTADMIIDNYGPYEPDHFVLDAGGIFRKKEDKCFKHVVNHKIKRYIGKMKRRDGPLPEWYQDPLL